jgi:hypothetical protein
MVPCLRQCAPRDNEETMGEREREMEREMEENGGGSGGSRWQQVTCGIRARVRFAGTNMHGASPSPLCTHTNPRTILENQQTTHPSTPHAHRACDPSILRSTPDTLHLYRNGSPAWWCGLCGDDAPFCQKCSRAKMFTPASVVTEAGS